MNEVIHTGNKLDQIYKIARTCVLNKEESQGLTKVFRNAKRTQFSGLNFLLLDTWKN